MQKVVLPARGPARNAIVVLARMETIKIRGLVRFSSWTFGVWGAMIFLKSLYDLGWGEPDANLYAPAKWAFVSQEQWLRYAGFEMAYGLACAAVAYYLFRFSMFVPETISRPRTNTEPNLF